jgi:enoyl-CoA hydratase/carnithine racemase
MAKYLVVEKLGHTAIITLNNPPANLWSLPALQELLAEMSTLDRDPSIRSVVMTGAGEGYFSAGADLKQFAGGDAAIAAEVADAFANAFRAVRQFHGVTVAAINGYALGGGLEWALSCDYMVAERGAKLGLPEARVGLVPCAGGTKALTDKVGVAWAKRIVLGGETIDADKALAIGLVEEVVDSGFAKIVAVSLANKVTAQGPAAVGEAGKLIESSPLRSLDEQLALEKTSFLRLFGQDEQREGVAAFLAKRTPSWQGAGEDDDEE